MDYTITGCAIEDVEFNMYSVDVAVGDGGFSVGVEDLGLEVDKVDVVLDLDHVVEVAANDVDDLRALGKAVQGACFLSGVDMPSDVVAALAALANDPDDLRALAVAVQTACDHAGVDMPGAFDGMGFEALSEALGLPPGDREPRRVLDYATRVVRAVKRFVGSFGLVNGMLLLK
tara:strand:+ start:144 stop:665 length:522 start_codon:yes stop_codon:yes gene_type:complete